MAKYVPLKSLLNCNFKFGLFLTSNCSSKINVEASVVILILRTVNLSQVIHKIKFAKNLTNPEKYFKFACDVFFCSVYKLCYRNKVIWKAQGVRQ